jgi:hypothetical protein
LRENELQECIIAYSLSLVAKTFKWAIQQYPGTKDADSLLDIAFRKGLIPAMRDEILAQN